MMLKFEEQATRFGADIRYGTITRVDFSERPFKLLVDDEKPVLADVFKVELAVQFVGGEDAHGHAAGKVDLHHGCRHGESLTRAGDAGPRLCG